jgi:hypothetical protein
MYKEPYFCLKQDMTLCITTPRKEYHRDMEWQHVIKSVSLGNTSKWTGAWSGVFISIKTSRVYIGLEIYAVMTNCMWKRAIMYTCSLIIQYHLKWNDWNPNGHATWCICEINFESWYTQCWVFWTSTLQHVRGMILSRGVPIYCKAVNFWLSNHCSLIITYFLPYTCITVWLIENKHSMCYYTWSLPWTIWNVFP